MQRGNTNHIKTSSKETKADTSPPCFKVSLHSWLKQRRWHQDIAEKAPAHKDLQSLHGQQKGDGATHLCQQLEASVGSLTKNKKWGLRWDILSSYSDWKPKVTSSLVYFVD